MSNGRLSGFTQPARTDSVSTTIYEQKIKPSSSEVHAIPARGIVSNHQEAVEHTHSFSSAVRIVSSENPRTGFRASVRTFAKGIATRMSAVFQRVITRTPDAQPEARVQNRAVVEVPEKSVHQIQSEAFNLVRLANPDTPRFEWKANSFILNYKNYIGEQLQLTRYGATYSTSTLKTLINRENSPLSPVMKEGLNSLISTVSSVEKAEEAKIYFNEAKKVPFSDREKYRASFEGCKEILGQVLGLDNNQLTLKQLKDAYNENRGKLPDSVDIELENHFTILERMDLMLNPVPEKPDAEFYQKGALMLRNETSALYDGFTGQVETFLQSKKYQLDAVPADYEKAPTNMDAVKHNLAILNQCLEKGDPLAFRSTAKQLAADFYETIQPLLGKYKEAAINSMGLSGDHWTGEELLNEYNQLNQTEGGLRDDNLKDILISIAFLETSKQKDFAENNGEKVKAQVDQPTALGLILNVVMRDQKVSQTIVETYAYEKKA